MTARPEPEERQADLFALQCPDCRGAMPPPRFDRCEGVLATECTCGFGIVGDDDNQIARAIAVLRTWNRREKRVG